MPGESEFSPLVSIDTHSAAASPRRAKTSKEILERARTESDDKKPGLNAVLNSLEETEQDKRLSIFLSLLGIVSHIVGGAVFLCLLEGWSFVDSMYFCIVTTTTVGYGDITPTTTFSKIFVISYVVISICLISSLLATFVSTLLDQQEQLLLATMVNEDNEEMVEELPHQPAAIPESRLPRFITRMVYGLHISDYYALGFSAFCLALVLAIGMLIFIFLEGYSVVDAIYVTIISATTVGFGDFEPKKDSTKILMTFWLTFSTIGVVKVIADFTDANVQAKQRMMTRRMLTAKMDMSTWTDMDRDNDGQVDKAEFVTELLIRTGKVERRECDALMKRFDELDTDKSGEISVSEVSGQIP